MAKGNNKKFERDPIAFCKEKCVNIQNRQGDFAVFNPRLAYQHSFFDLKPWGKNQVIFTPCGSGTWGGKDTILRAYYFPYIAYGDLTSTGHAAVPLKGIPKTNPAYNYIFTGGVNGCSPMLLKGDYSNTVWGFHYPNSDGKKKGYPLLSDIGKTADDIIISLDFDVYGTDTNPNGFAFFYYYNGQWTGVVQSQIQGVPDASKGVSSMSINKSMGVNGVTHIIP